MAMNIDDIINRDAERAAKLERHRAVKVTQDPDAPVERAVLADAIVRISRAFQRLSTEGGLTQQAVEVLVQHLSGVRVTDVRAVLKAIRQLEQEFVTPAHRKKAA
jgi:hypothetical protein